MIEFAINVAFVSIGIAVLLALWRLLRGPDVPDRVLALDTLYINAVAFIVLLGVRTASVAYFEAALLIALFGFVATVALARFVTRGDVMD
ncbi:MAG TPA: K+/H+ antiporter subunit F [Burkholderiales bacterium]|jgi:multicomponent K+:H+ antiporter subunit F|nr:K+/H+ antiporter subunit F [Burkholderiales bacterium]